MIKIFYGWWIVLATNVICMLGFGTWLYSFGVFFKPMSAEFGWTRAMTAGAYSFRNIQGGIASPIAGWAVDKYGARIVIIIGAIISGLSFCLMPFINSIIDFYLVYGILLSAGMSAMLYIPAWTVIAKWFNKRLSLALAILATGAGLGGLFCAPAAAYLIKYYGWRAAFVVFGFAIWIVVIPLAFVVKNSPEEMGLLIDGKKVEDEDRDERSSDKEPAPTQVDFTLKQALISSSFWMLSLSFFFQGVSHSTVTVHMVPALTDAGIPVAKAAYSIGLLTFVSIIGRLGFGYLGDHFSKRYLFIATYAFMGTGLLVLMNTRTMPMVYLFIFLFGIGFGGNVPLMPAIRTEYFGRSALGAIQGFMTPMMMLSGAVGPIVAGYIYDKTGSYRISFLAIGVLTFFAAVAMFFAKPSVPRQTKSREALTTI